MKSFADLDLDGQKVLLRVDLNVPVDKGIIQDYSRIERLKPTIELLKNKGARIILISHFGRPEGKRNPDFSLKFMLSELERIFSCKVGFAATVEELSKSPEKGEIVLLENLRFYAEEEANDYKFASKLAAHADIYVNDAFSCSHRAHASIVAITKFLPSYAGLLLEEEVKNLRSLVGQDVRPLVAIIGGKKVSTKFKVLRFMDVVCDSLVICGAMANTMLAAFGHDIKDSFYEPDLIAEAKEFMRHCRAQIVLPVDAVVADKQGSVAVRPINLLRTGESIFDIGPASCLQVMNLLEQSSALLWNGPFGMFEDVRFRAATDMVARQVGLLTSQGRLKSIAGGGDTVSALEQSGLAHEFSYISTAGGAFLEWLESGSLVGLEALNSSGLQRPTY